MRWIGVVAFAYLVVGCRTTERFDVDDEPCALAAEYAVCQACLTGAATCSYDGARVTAVSSCRTCQAERLLYQTLCDDGVAQIEGEVVCRW